MQQAARVSDRTAFFTVEVHDDGSRTGTMIRPDRDDLHQPERPADRGLRDGAVRMTRETFHEELEKTELELLTMGELTSTAVQRSVQALVERDNAMAQKVVEDDDPIDDLYLKIDRRPRMLALQSPVADDLRLVSAILHCDLHLERIGDQAVNVAKIYLTRDGAGEPIHASADRGDGRASSSHGAHRDGGVRPAGPRSRAQGSGHGRPCRPPEPYTHLEALKLADDPNQLDWGLHMNMAGRALERVGDNAVDVGEQVGFLMTGEFREFTDASHPVVME